MKTTDILSYSRKPPNPAFQAILDALSSSQQETWNLMFLLLPVESRYVFTRNLLEGDVDWPEVYRALAEIGFKGTATVELGAGDEAYLREVSRRFDLILTNSTNA